MSCGIQNRRQHADPSAKPLTYVARFAVYLLLMVASGCPDGVIAASSTDPWIGTYRHDHQIGKISGVAAQITYTLAVHAGTGMKGATLTALGYQTNDKVLCDTKAEHDKLHVYFRSYPDGDTANQYGVELYQPGALLLTLERRGDQLITRWGEYNAEAANREREGLQFRKVSPSQPR